MIDIKKYMCLYLLNNFGIFSKSNFISNTFLCSKQIEFNPENKINIYGALFELSDFKLKIFSSNTIEDTENHSILFFEDKLIGLAYNKKHYLISNYSDKFTELSILNTCDLIKSIEIFKQLFISPTKLEITEEEYKIFLKYINYSFDIMESNEAR